MNEKRDIDKLLYATADQMTARAGLDSILHEVYESRSNAHDGTQAASGSVFAPVWKRVTAAMAAVLLIAMLSMPAIAKAVVIDGKRYIAVSGQINMNGETVDISEREQSGELVRLENTNQYVTMEDAEESSAPGTTEMEVFVYPVGECPTELKNPLAVSGEKEEPRSLEPVWVYPIVGDLVVREGPDAAYSQLAMLHAGQCVKKVGIYGDWAILSWQGGIAYAFNAYLFEAGGEETRTERVTMRATEPVNVRALPTSREESAVLAELQTDRLVVCTGSIGGWNQIEWENGHAYVFGKYLEKTEGEAE